MAQTIKFIRGAIAGIPTLADGEPGYASDVSRLYVGNAGTNVPVNRINLSAGTTSNHLSNVTFSNSNNVSFGLNGSTVTGSYAFNVSGGTTSNNLSNIVFSNSNGVSFGLNGSTMTASVSAAGGGTTLSEWQPFPCNSFVINSTLGQNSIYFVPFDLPAPLSAYRLNHFASISYAQQPYAGSTGGYTVSAALYTRMTESTDRVSRLWSGSWYIAWTDATGLGGSITLTHPLGISNSTAGSVKTTAGRSNNSWTDYLNSSIGGFRAIHVPVSLTLTPGRYWMAMANSTGGPSTAGPQFTINIAQQNSTQTGFGGPFFPPFRPFGTASAASDASFYAMGGAIGTYSATSGAFPASVALTTDAIRADSLPIVPLFNFSGYTTGTNVL